MALLVESSRAYGRGVLQGIANYSHSHGRWSFFMVERDLHGGIPKMLDGWKGEGIIARIEDRRMAERLLRLGIPLVDVLGQRIFPKIPSFDTDAAAVARMAVDFFRQAGFQNFAFIGYPGIPFSDRRELAFRGLLGEHGFQARVFGEAASARKLSNIQVIERQGIGAQEGIAEWLKRQPRPVAVLACNDVRAHQVLNACREHGLEVPENVAVLGVDNDDVLCNLCDPPLSSIEPDTSRLGYEAAKTLHSLMNNEPVTPENRQIPPIRLVERTSTDTLAIEDPVTVQAMRFIRDNVGSGIAVKDVMREVQRSRTDIEQRFRRWMKTSVRAEILRCRMSRVCALLSHTNLKLAEVAKRAGFASAAHLCRLFQQQFQKSPTEFRQGCKIR